jgi:hypothetical protein
MAADDSRDVVDCGIGNDRAIVDSFDVVSKSCESVQTTSSGPAGPAPKTPGGGTTTTTTTTPDDDGTSTTPAIGR